MSGEMFLVNIETPDFIELYSQNSPFSRGEFPLHLIERVRVRQGHDTIM